jgi:hypothetical protein
MGFLYFYAASPAAYIKPSEYQEFQMTRKPSTPIVFTTATLTVAGVHYTGAVYSGPNCGTTQNRNDMSHALIEAVRQGIALVCLVRPAGKGRKAGAVVFEHVDGAWQFSQQRAEGALEGTTAETIRWFALPKVRHNYAQINARLAAHAATRDPIRFVGEDTPMCRRTRSCWPPERASADGNGSEPGR